jgi:hypothetical protein
MPIIQLIVVLVVVGVLLWLVNTYVPMADPIKTILNVVVVIAVVLWLLSVFGLFSMGGPVIGHRRPFSELLGGQPYSAILSLFKARLNC